MKIIKLESENIKRLKAIQIEPKSNMVVIGGNNGEGKSSTLDSILYALGGKAAICDEPINRSAKKAKVVCDMGELIVTRTFTKSGGGTLTVTNKAGAKYDSPQKLLDTFVGQLAFDPLEFSNRGKTSDGRKWQLEMLKTLVGLDFTEIEQKRADLYQQRTVVNTKGKSLKSQLETTKHYPDAPGELVSVSELMKELKRRQDVNEKNTKIRNYLKVRQERATRLTADESELLEKLKAVRDQIAANTSELDGASAACKKLQDLDTEETSKQINSAEETNKKVNSNASRVQLDTMIETNESESSKLTDEINDIDKEKSSLLSKAKFPVTGLSFDEDGVTYKDLPFDQASDAEKLRVSVAMGIAMNPKLKVILIRNGSLLDSNSRSMLCDMATTSGHQIWMEVVGKDKDCSVIIEDGSIESDSEGSYQDEQIDPDESLKDDDLDDYSDI